MLEKARSIAADEVVIDLEDSVAPDLKAEARGIVVAALREGGFPGSVAVRVNSLSSEWGAQDVDAVAGLADSLVLPKVEAPEDPGAPFQALIETAAGLTRAVEIAARSTNLEGLIIGFADLAASLGREIDSDWGYARETVLVAARAAGVQAIDGPYLDIADLEGLRADASRARASGFDGKWAVHPSQVAPLNEVFSPTEAEVARSEAVLAALSETGVAALDGEMIDEASRKRALDVIARAKAGG